jgi:hypothetical protein
MNLRLDNAKNLIVTGVPRAGTTLTAALLDSLSDTVCINEPKWQGKWSREAPDRASYVARLARDFADVRETLLAGGSVMARVRPDGEAVTNYFDETSDSRKRLEIQLAPMARPGLAPDFLLAMKHNAHYACVLPELARLEEFRVLSIIRDPVATLASWASIDLPVSKASMPAAEPFWPEIKSVRQATDDLLTAQARLLELIFARFHALRDRIAIVRLEDVIADPQLFSRLLGRDQVRPVNIAPSKIPSSLQEKDRARIREAVARHCPTASAYYPS